MSKDFNVKGRESFLSQIYFSSLSGFEREIEFTFARWTLLERVIWKFIPNSTYCHLDGFDLDVAHHYHDGFIGIGRVWLLENSKSGGDIYTAMAVEFDENNHAIKSARFWVSTMPVIKGNAPPHFEILPLKELLTQNRKFNRDWQIALTRNSSNWKLNPHFDLSIFLNPLNSNP